MATATNTSTKSWFELTIEEEKRQEQDEHCQQTDDIEPITDIEGCNAIEIQSACEDNGNVTKLDGNETKLITVMKSEVNTYRDGEKKKSVVEIPIMVTVHNNGKCYVPNGNCVGPIGSPKNPLSVNNGGRAIPGKRSCNVLIEKLGNIYGGDHARCLCYVCCGNEENYRHCNKKCGRYRLFFIFPATKDHLVCNVLCSFVVTFPSRNFSSEMCKLNKNDSVYHNVRECNDCNNVSPWKHYYDLFVHCQTAYFDGEMGRVAKMIHGYVNEFVKKASKPKLAPKKIYRPPSPPVRTFNNVWVQPKTPPKSPARPEKDEPQSKPQLKVNETIKDSKTDTKATIDDLNDIERGIIDQADTEISDKSDTVTSSKGPDPAQIYIKKSIAKKEQKLANMKEDYAKHKHTSYMIICKINELKNVIGEYEKSYSGNELKCRALEQKIEAYKQKIEGTKNLLKC